MSLSRELGVDDFAVFVEWMATLGILSQFTAFGTSAFLFTRIRRKTNITERAFSTIICIRSFIFVLTTITLLICVVLNIQNQYSLLILIVCFAEILLPYREVAFVKKYSNHIAISTSVGFISGIILLITLTTLNVLNLWTSIVVVVLFRVSISITYLYKAKSHFASEALIKWFLPYKKRFVVYAKSSFFLMVTTILSTTNISLPIYIYNGVGDVGSAAGYGAVLRLVLVILIFPSIMANVLYNNLPRKLFKNYSFSIVLMTGYMALTVIFVMPTIYLSSDYVVFIVFGSTYSQFGHALSLLSLLIIPHGLRMIYSKSLLLAGLGVHLMLQAILISVFNLIIIVILYELSRLDLLYHSLLIAEILGFTVLMFIRNARHAILRF